MNLTTNQITFLKNVPNDTAVDMRSGWRYHHFNDFTIEELSSFIRIIGDDKIYLLIPLFASSKSLSDATLNLSEPFLIDNESNPALIIKFIIDQWNSSGFSRKQDCLITFSFKFKRVWLSYK